MDEPETAWQEWCHTLARTGTAIGGPGFPDAPQDRAEGYRYLARLAVFALQWHLELDDPRHPAFYGFDDDLTQWGAPNADNHYLRAAVEADGTYRVTGDVTGVRQLILSTHRGDMALGEHAVLEERNLADLRPGVDGQLEVVLARSEPPWCTSTFVPLADGVEYVLVRTYVADWEHDGIADLRIERLDTIGTVAPPQDPAGVARALRRAAVWTERSAAFWNTYAARLAAGVGENTMSPPFRVPDGAADIRYGSGTWQLGDGEALLVAFDAPDAEYWSVQAYTPGWFEAIDLRHRQTSLNGAQAHVDGDGRVRVVVSADDPGVPNWIDTGGHPRGVLAYRWVWATTFPEPSARVVALAELRAALPADHPEMSPEKRRLQLASRQRGIARRFRR